MKAEREAIGLLSDKLGGKPGARGRGSKGTGPIKTLISQGLYTYSHHTLLLQRRKVGLREFK